MAELETRQHARHLTDPAPLAMAALAVPLFIWSAFNADYFDRSGENFIIPFAVFLGGPVAVAAAMWAYYHRDAFLGTLAGAFGAFWLSYGMLLWLTHENVVDPAVASDGDLRGLFFIAWMVTFGVLWLASIKEHWTLSLLALGMGAMFLFLSIGYYDQRENTIKIGGWIGFVTAALAWYSALAEMLNSEFEQPVLPTDAEWFRRFHFGAR